MTAGRKRKPEYLKAIEGTQRKDRQNPEAPEAAPAVPVPPDWLPHDAHPWFYVLVERLMGIGQASETFTETIAAAAGRILEIEQANEDIERYGRIIESINIKGDEKFQANPALGQRDKAVRHLQSLLAECGLTPATISKLSAPGSGGGKRNQFEGM